MKKYGIVYKIENIVSGKVYIGQTTKNFKRRYSCKGDTPQEKVFNYLTSCKKNKKYYCKELYNDMIRIGICNFKVVEEICACYSKEELDKMEAYHINLNKNNYNFFSGGKYKDEDKEKMSKLLKGSKKSIEWKKKIADSRLGKYNGENSYINKKVKCIETGDIYYSITNAKQLTGIDDSCIAKCCKGKRKSAGGYTWSYI